MTQTSKKGRPKKKPGRLTSDEVMKKVFPKKIVKELDKITGKNPPKNSK
jgi:hypothetical protein